MRILKSLGLLVLSASIFACGKTDNMHDFEYDFAESEDIQSARDGSYQGMVEDKLDQANVEVTVQDGEITDIEIIDVVAFGWRQDEVLEKVPAQIIEAQSLDIDGVSGATGSVNGVKIAVSRAIEKAQAE